MNPGSGPMNEEELGFYRQAGEIAARTLTKGAGMIRPGASYLEVVETVEAMVIDAGACLAFPLNLSLNEDAAHDTASPGDDRVFSAGDVAKLDLGVHLEGRIADTACTVDLGEHPLLCEASRAALSAALSMVRPGVSVGEIGAVIHREITIRGFRPVANLTGHGLRPYVLHGPPNVPNIPVDGGTVLEEGMAFAIEPFASTGTGRVSDRRKTEIFAQLTVKPVRLESGRRLLNSIRDRRGLPFSRRWVTGCHPDLSLPALMRNGIIRGYPVLGDVPGSLVSQAEHTCVVTSDGCIVTTGQGTLMPGGEE